jgi:hypothetical protein
MTTLKTLTGTYRCARQQSVLGTARTTSKRDMKTTEILTAAIAVGGLGLASLLGASPASADPCFTKAKTLFVQSLHNFGVSDPSDRDLVDGGWSVVVREKQGYSSTEEGGHR